jgi:chromosomal replication initiation ATPase DnaA
VSDPDHPQVDAIGARETSDRQRKAPTGATAAHLDAIVEKVAQTFHFSAEELRTRKRGQHLAFCRQVAMYLCRHDGASLPAVGRALKRHHSTVLYDVRFIERRLHGPGHGGFRAFIETLQRRIITAPQQEKSSASCNGTKARP